MPMPVAIFVVIKGLVVASRHQRTAIVVAVIIVSTIRIGVAMVTKVVYMQVVIVPTYSECTGHAPEKRQ